MMKMDLLLSAEYEHFLKYFGGFVKIIVELFSDYVNDRILLAITLWCDLFRSLFCYWFVRTSTPSQNDDNTDLCNQHFFLHEN